MSIAGPYSTLQKPEGIMFHSQIPKKLIAGQASMVSGIGILDKKLP